MIQEPTVVHTEPVNDSAAHVVHALMQFLLAVRYRKHVVFLALLVSGVLGAVYYATATRYYGANASILVLQGSTEDYSPSLTTESTRQRNLMPTFVQLLTSTKVVQGAIPLLRPEDCVDFGDAPREAWPFIIKANLSAEDVRSTNIIEASYRSKDPKAAVAVLNAVVRSYVAFLDATHKGTSQLTIQVLGQQQAELVAKITQTEGEQLRLSDQIGDIGSHSNAQVLHPTVKSALFFGEKLTETQTQRIELEATLAAIQSAIRSGEDLQQHVMAVANVVGEELLLNSLGINRHDVYLQAETQRSLLEEQANLASMQIDLGPNHPEVIAKMQLIRSTHQYLAGYSEQIKAKVSRIQGEILGPKLEQMMRQKLDEIRNKEASLQAKSEQALAQASALNGQLARLVFLEKHLEWLRKSHDNLLDEIAGIDMKSDGQEVRTEVVHEPVEASRPVSPNLRKVVMMVLMGGLGLGLAMVYVLDTLDDRFRSMEEMQGQLNVPVLAMVRQLQTPTTSGAEALQMHTAPNSGQCEAFRTLRTGLALADKEARQIVISSAEPGDGKTTVLANLAVSYAQSDKRTLLIDADLRRPGLTALMGMRGVDGLSGLVRGSGSVVDMAAAYVRRSGIEGLDILPSGPRPANPAELLANPRFSELLAWAESVYDQVLIDSPPTLATSDTAVIGRLVDGVVMVVQPDKNRRRMVTRAVEGLTALKIPLLGIVVNRVGCDEDRGYYGYGYGYGYAYGYGYGTDEESQETAEEAVDEEDGGTMTFADASACEDADCGGGIVPRRVA